MTKAGASAGGKHTQSLPARSGPGDVRIIGGKWKRSRLPVANHPGLRPTPNRVRETLFNWLGQDLAGWRCVDAFAGSGALGFEAASRGATDVLLCEQDVRLVAQLRQLGQRLGAEGIRVEHGDGVTVLRQFAPGSIDLVFLDPPFDAGLETPALAAAAIAIHAHRGRIYLEASLSWSAEQLAAMGLELLKHLRAGNVHAHLLRAAS